MRKKEELLVRLDDTDKNKLFLEVLTDIRDILLWIMKELRDGNKGD